MDDGIDEQRGGLKRRLPGCFIIDGNQKQSRFWRGGGELEFGEFVERYF